MPEDQVPGLSAPGDLDEPPLLVLAGPTASGKTAVAIPLARRLGAQIVSFDSMAVYRGMDIGTAKPSEAQREAVRHHLIDVADPGEAWSVGEHLRRAEEAFARIRQEGARPLVVGGTFLYLKALLFGLEDGPRSDPRQRQQWIEREEEEGPGTLHRMLRERDARAAERLHEHDLHRIVRALEKAVARERRESRWDPRRPQRIFRLAVLLPPLEVLQGRIEARVRSMFDRGLVEEAQQVADLGGLSRTAREAIGYREALAVARGERDQEEAVRETIRRTRLLCRRQLTWLRSFPQARFVRPRGEESEEELVDLAARALEDPP